MFPLTEPLPWGRPGVPWSLIREPPAPKMLVPVPQEERVARLEVSNRPEPWTSELVIAEREDRSVSTSASSTLKIPPEAKSEAKRS